MKRREPPEEPPGQGAVDHGNVGSDERSSHAELERQREELAALHETTLDLISRLETTSLLGAILSRAAGLLGADHAYLYVVDERDDRLVVRAGIGIFAEYLGYRLDRGQGLAGRVWETGEPLAVEDYTEWSGRVSGFEMIRAAMALPLRAGGDIVGVIGLCHLEKGPRFGEEQVDLLGRFARLASLALDNARLYSDAQDELRERRKAEKELERSADELRQANEDLRAADEMKDHFVAVTSHELKTPLTSVLGFSKLLQSSWDRITDEDKREQIGLIASQAERLVRMVDELLTISRIEAGALEVHPESVSVKETAESVVSSLRSHDVDIRSVGEERVMADPGHLHQILTNYLTNALRHGRPPVRVECRRDGEVVEIGVCDAGDGVPDAFLSRLFDRFARAGSGGGGGTGLGLSIVRGLAEAQGGEAAYEPGEQGESRFVVRLPAG